MKLERALANNSLISSILVPAWAAKCHGNVKRLAGRRPSLPDRAVLEFFVPSHLDGFELALVGCPRIALKVGQFGHVTMQVGEADGEGIEFGMNFREQDADVFGVVPGE